MKCIVPVVSLLVVLSGVANARPAPMANQSPASIELPGSDLARIVRLEDAFGDRVGSTETHEDLVGLLRNAADLGDANSMNSLGVAYATGSGVTQDFGKALQWFFEGYNNGSVEAAFNIGLANYLGHGVPLDYAKAAEWFDIAAQKGDASAMNLLALMYARGISLEKDSHKASVLFQESARRHNPVAMMNLGVSYALGEFFEQDFVLAYVWLTAALANGLPSEFRENVVYNLGMLAAKLNEEQLIRVQKLVEDVTNLLPASRRK